MRRFTLGSATDRKIVVIDLTGTRMSVVQMMPDGSSKRKEQDLSSEAAARSASDQLVQQLLSRGYVEQVSRPAKKSKPAAAVSRPAAAASQPATVSRPAASGPMPAGSTPPPPRRPWEDEEDDGSPLYDLIEETPKAPEPVLARIASVAEAGATVQTKPKKKKKKSRGKNKKVGEGGDGLDKRVLAGVGGVGVLLLAGLGFIAYDTFLKPPTIVGTWRGSMTDYEIGGPIVHSEYELILDEQKRASMTLQDEINSIGTYSLKGDRLKLVFKDDEGSTSEQEYKVVLGRVTLDLKDPETGKLAVQLIRFREPPVIGKKAAPPAAPTDTSLADDSKVDKAADESLASVEFSPKDGAFKLRHPPGWEPETGSRPDNTYSWANFTKDSAKIQVYADVTGSLMSGSDSAGQHEEGDESAPVHIAHQLYTKTASEEFSDYVESKPAVFKGSQLGEGRVSTFTAAGGGLFGSKLRGYHVTLMSRDRRVSILCHCPEKEFPKLKATFLAVCRSFSR